jgi:hypothetical protein
VWHVGGEKKWKQFSLREKKTFLEELGNCDSARKYIISPLILSTFLKSYMIMKNIVYDVVDHKER